MSPVREVVTRWRPFSTVGTLPRSEFWATKPQVRGFQWLLKIMSHFMTSYCKNPGNSIGLSYFLSEVMYTDNKLNKTVTHFLKMS